VTPWIAERVEACVKNHQHAGVEWILSKLRFCSLKRADPDGDYGTVSVPVVSMDVGLGSCGLGRSFSVCSCRLQPTLL